MVTSNRFSGRKAVITGGAAGIGLAIANRIANEGGTPIIWDRDAEAIEKAISSGAAADGAVVDVTDRDAVDKAAAGIAATHGTIDILVCSAGITGPNKPLIDYPADEWRKVFDVNVHGVFNCNAACAPYMVKNGYGRIVNIASVAGKEGNPNASAYSASKAAVIGLTKSLGKELAKHPVTVNCVTPAAVKTAIFDQMTPEHIDFMLSKIPMGRFGKVEEIASLVTWLASEECSFTTAGVFDISGGRATY